ncbi:hypothetical protein D4764_16G0000200 [Takifugu flavidus]|uniref:Uncharacterized protein n=1 Tax=Takifugu flavidus TaxID=433684 RepID=A0A5C6NW47_9TELE|nr:hypothetical protein D4764_16G0000200 [Takifugu flavidus]
MPEETSEVDGGRDLIAGQAWTPPEVWVCAVLRTHVRKSTPPQDAPGDPVIGLFQVHKVHVDWLGKLAMPVKHPSKGSAARQLFHYLGNLCPEIGWSTSWSPNSVPPCGYVLVGLRSSWKYSFHCRIIAPGDVSSSPRTPSMSSSIASLNSSHARRGLAAATRESCLDNGGTEHGPFRLNVPYLPWNGIKALLEGDEDQPDGFPHQVFPTNPHYAFGSARSMWCPPTPDPTHNQTVPPNPQFPGHAVVTHVSVEVSQENDGVPIWDTVQCPS